MKKLISTFALSMLLFTSINAGSDRPIHEIHSMMIYNFIKYIQWPGYDSSQDFVIGVIGEDDVFNTLNTWYNGKVRGDKKFLVKKFNSANDITGCHIIYVGKNQGKSFDAI
ncbi:MAG: YfiR family protein, partial [Fulvivirga sp.]